jgi:septal ring factor EnvC (AmiA/AmiB activator)
VKKVPIDDRLDNHERELWEKTRKITELEKKLDVLTDTVRALSNRIAQFERPKWDDAPDATQSMRRIREEATR